MTFHLMARPRGGWLALAELALLIAIFIFINFAAVLAFGIADPEWLNAFMEDDAARPADVYIIAFSIAAPLLAAWIARRNPAGLISVESRVRWRYVGLAAAVAVPVFGAIAVYDALQGGLTVNTSTLAVAIAMVFVVPVQSATEELMFRAALPQIVGNWLKPAWVAYGASVLPFVFMHLYNLIGLVDIFIFAVCAAYLTWRSGGIEQATVLHAASNTYVFVFQALRPDVVPTTEVSWADTALFSSLTIGVTVGIALLTRAKTGTAIPTAPVRPVAQVPANAQVLQPQPRG